MNKHIILFVTCIMMLCSFNGVFAINLSFVDLGYSAKDIDIFYPNGTLYANLLSNETITIHDTNKDYEVVVRPQKMELIENPFSFLSFLLENISEIGTALVVLGAIGSIILWRSRR